MSEKIDVLLYGLGAIGSFYAFIFSRSPEVRLTVVARSNYEDVKKNGFTINSDNHGIHTVIPHNVVKDPSEAEGKFNYVVLTSKAIDLDSVPSRLAPVIDPLKTIIIIVQNGVGNEDPFRKAFPQCTILSIVVWVRVFSTSPSTFRHTKWENTQIGLFPNPSLAPSLETSRLNAFVSLLQAGPTPVDIWADIQVARWEKTVWNVAWNSLTTLTQLDVQSFLSSTPDAMPLTRRLMEEVICVARKCGVEMREGLVDELIGKVVGRPPLGTSMAADCREGRQMEVEIILGSPVRKAREMGVECPVLETLYVLLGGVNFRMRVGQAVE